MEPKEQENLKNEQEALKKIILFRALTKKARERINMVRAANPELAERAEMVLIQTFQTRQKIIGEEEVKSLLRMLSHKRKPKIRM